MYHKFEFYLHARKFMDENPVSKLIAWDFRKDFKCYFVFVPKTS